MNSNTNLKIQQALYRVSARLAQERSQPQPAPQKASSPSPNGPSARPVTSPCEANPGASPAGRKWNDIFRQFSQTTASFVGCPWAFGAALAVIVVWAVTGPLFGFSDTWQLVINTATTIITFLMVFLIQNTQNRDAKAIHLKLDELIHAAKGARNSLVNLENLSDEELANLQKEFERLGRIYNGKDKQQPPPADVERHN